MSVFHLNEELVFPSAEQADSEGFLAIGGDLSKERLLLAYRNGIFPWFSERTPILWWSPDPRCVLFPEKLKISKTMKQVLKRAQFEISYNRDFKAVIGNCKMTSRPGQEDTWITGDMLNAYIQLHREGYAHSVEVWKDGELTGGLYGLALGKCFFGESMFSKVSNSSKAGFITLINTLKEKGISIIDCQVTTSHLISMGAEEIPRRQFLQFLKKGIPEKTTDPPKLELS